jgi:predicted TIM-barrel fold metal-dependent hydrolase
MNYDQRTGDLVIVDAHTHVFPPAMIERRADLLRLEPVFAELYANPRARMATAGDLLGAMAAAGVDASVIAGFAWSDPALCRQHNDYLLESAAASERRLLPFCTLPLADPAAARREAERVAGGGASGLGELRPESQGSSLAEPATAELLEWASTALALPLLIHASEPVGHAYPGKAGQNLGGLYGFISRCEGARVIAAHWGGGLPFYALMPEVRDALGNVWVDTAASSLLYDPAIYRVVIDLVGRDRVLFGSDYPLLSQKTQVKAVKGVLRGDELQAVLGGNAAEMFHLQEQPDE